MEQPKQRDCHHSLHMPQEPLTLFQWCRRPALERMGMAASEDVLLLEHLERLKVYELLAFWKVCTFTFMHLADAFIQSDLQCIQDIHFFHYSAFPGNRTHNLLRCKRNALPLSHRNTYERPSSSCTDPRLVITLHFSWVQWCKGWKTLPSYRLEGPVSSRPSPVGQQFPSQDMGISCLHCCEVDAPELGRTLGKLNHIKESDGPQETARRLGSSPAPRHLTSRTSRTTDVPAVGQWGGRQGPGPGRTEEGSEVRSSFRTSGSWPPPCMSLSAFSLNNLQ